MLVGIASRREFCDKAELCKVFIGGFDSRRELRGLVARCRGRPPEVRSVPIPFRAPSSEKRKRRKSDAFFFGADYGARTRHLRLGKATLYQMS